MSPGSVNLFEGDMYGVLSITMLGFLHTLWYIVVPISCTIESGNFYISYGRGEVSTVNKNSVNTHLNTQQGEGNDIGPRGVLGVIGGYTRCRCSFPATPGSAKSRH